MRAIKFRAWDLIEKRMLRWGEIFHLPAWEIFPGTPEQRPWIIMQFTGLLDKNGKEIYEGDIVKFYTFSTKKSGMIRPVVWDEVGAWFPFNDDTYTDDEQGDWFQRDGFEVIGNIHENPEVLK